MKFDLIIQKILNPNICFFNLFTNIINSSKDNFTYYNKSKSVNKLSLKFNKLIAIYKKSFSFI